jgi:hypothetical protein
MIVTNGSRARWLQILEQIIPKPLLMGSIEEQALHFTMRLQLTIELRIRLRAQYQSRQLITIACLE